MPACRRPSQIAQSLILPKFDVPPATPSGPPAHRPDPDDYNSPYSRNGLTGAVLHFGVIEVD